MFFILFSKTKIGNRDVTAHIYEYTTQSMLTLLSFFFFFLHLFILINNLLTSIRQSQLEDRRS